MGLRQEIGEQSAVAERLLADGSVEVAALARDIRRRPVDFVVIAARGTSDNAATYAQYALGSVAGLPVVPAAPSLDTRYRTPLRLRRALVMGISQSGRSPDIVAVVAEGRRQGQLTAALTNDPDSPLAAAAEHVVWLRAGTEASVAATKTYAAQLLAVGMLAAKLSGNRRRLMDLQRVPDVIEQALSTAEAVAEAAAATHRSMQEAAILGRGFHLATALEWALKLKELAYVRAQGYSTADFQHGPAASLAPGGHLLAVSAPGPLEAELDALLTTLASTRDARLLRVASGATDGRGALRYPDGLPEWLTPLGAIVPIQLFCYHLARAKGLDFEAPRGLRKVTLTR